MTGRSWYDSIAIVKSFQRFDAPAIEKKSGHLVFPKGITKLLPAHKNYLRSRGFKPKEIAELWDVKGIGIAKNPLLSWRLFIPMQYQDHIVTWTTRSISNASSAPRYITASPMERELSNKDFVYGTHFARNRIVICEGPLDVWRIGPGAVAITGLSYSRKQVAEILKFPYRTICFDNEPDAQRRAQRLLDELSVFDGVTQNVILDASDPGSASPKEISKLRSLFLKD